MKFQDPRKAALRAMLRRTSAGRKILSSLKLSGTSPESLELGASKFMKKLKSVGKVTSKITGRIAKVAAGLVGIPPGAIDALAKADPTAHKAVLKTLVTSPAGNKAAAIVEKAENEPGKIKPVYIYAGAAGLIAILLITAKKRRA